MIHLFLIFVVLLPNFGESIKMGFMAKPMYWKGCGKNSTLIKHQIVLRPNCIKHTLKNQTIVIQDNRILSSFPLSVDTSVVNARLHVAPFALKISYHSPNRKLTCSGSIIGDRWILTTGVCATGVVTGPDEAYTIYYGSSDTSKARVAQVSKAFPKPGYRENDRDNIGILRLTEDLKQVADYFRRQYTVNTACLPDSYDYSVIKDQPAVEYGWIKGNLIKRSESIAKDCQRPAGFGLICTDQNTECPTDEGGPLVVYNDRGQAIQIGIALDTPCHARRFIDLRKNMNWIIRTVRRNTVYR